LRSPALDLRRDFLGEEAHVLFYVVVRDALIAEHAVDLEIADHLAAMAQRIGIETRRLLNLSTARFPRAPLQTGQAAFTASGFPSKAVLTDTSFWCRPMKALAITGWITFSHSWRIHAHGMLTLPWTAALRLVDGLPVL